MGYDFELEGEDSVVLPCHGPDPSALSIDGRVLHARLCPGDTPGASILEVDGRREPVFVAARGDDLFIHYRGRAHHVRAIDALERARREADPSGGEEMLRAPMPGVVVAITTAVGATVEAGELLMTIESMKLQTSITAPHAARVAEICVAPAASFDQGALLVRLEAITDESVRDEGRQEAPR